MKSPPTIRRRVHPATEMLHRPPTHSVVVQQDSWFGFPNPGQICYMNSSLQSLLTLREFIMDVSSQEEVWSLNPDWDHEAERRYSLVSVISHLCYRGNTDHRPS